MKEIWRDVPNYEGFYKASNLGSIKSFHKKERILKAGIKNNGYELIMLNKDGYGECFHVHSLVFLAFRGIKGNKNFCINHKNGIKTDNRLINLELISKGDDIRHAYRNGLRKVQTEREIMIQIRKRLELYKHHKQVIWFSRLQCGKIHKGYYWINLCDKGTPDFIVLIRNSINNITVLFIEAKSDTGKLRKDQILFSNKHNKFKDVHVITISDISVLDDFINKNSYDYTKDMPEDL